MKRPAAERSERSTAVRKFYSLADTYRPRRRCLGRISVRRGIQRTCVRSSRLRPTVPGAVSTWSPRPVAGHTNSHNDRGRQPTNDLRLLGAHVEQKADKANRNLVLIIRGRHHDVEGSTR
jgi:hypothetical protein